MYGSGRKKKNDDEIIGIVIGILATLILLLFILMIIIIIRQRRGKFANHRAVKAVHIEAHSNGTVNLNDIHNQTTSSANNGKLSNGKIYNCVASSDIESDREGTWTKMGSYRDPLDCIQHRKLPELPRTPESTGSFLFHHIMLNHKSTLLWLLETYFEK